MRHAAHKAAKVSHAQFEADLTELDEDDAREMLADAGLEESMA